MNINLHYEIINKTMAEALNFAVNKQPYKIIEVPLAKFTEDIIPHHQNVYQQYKSTINNLVALNESEQLGKEIKEKKRNVKQLRYLMYELDTLRTQVEDEDLDKFDMKTLSLRKVILNLITGYTELEKSVDRVISSNIKEYEKENLEHFGEASQIQIQGTLEEVVLKQREEQLSKVENINKDVQDLHDIYKHLNEMAENQSELVNHIENDIDNTQQNVIEGTRNLSKSHKLKAVAYPVTGAFIGSMIGGPIGLVAGLKIGGVAAITCAIAGYTGGRWFKKKHLDEEPSEVELVVASQDENMGKKQM